MAKKKIAQEPCIFCQGVHQGPCPPPEKIEAEESEN